MSGVGCGTLLQGQEEAYHNCADSKRRTHRVSRVCTGWLFMFLAVVAMQEHKCVLDSCRAMESEGFEVTYLPVQENGIINLKVCMCVCILCSKPGVCNIFGRWAI